MTLKNGEIAAKWNNEMQAFCEDVPFDMEAYTDSCGNSYDFGFGLDWSGPIRDARWEKYVRDK